MKAKDELSQRLPKDARAQYLERGAMAISYRLDRVNGNNQYYPAEDHPPIDVTVVKVPVPELPEATETEAMKEPERDIKTNFQQDVPLSPPTDGNKTVPKRVRPPGRKSSGRFRTVPKPGDGEPEDEPDTSRFDEEKAKRVS